MNMLDIMNLLYKHHIRMYIEPDEFKLGYMQVTFRTPHQGLRKTINLEAFNSISGGSGDSILMDVIAGELRRFIDDIIKELERKEDLVKRTIMLDEFLKAQEYRKDLVKRVLGEDDCSIRSEFKIGSGTDVEHARVMKENEEFMRRHQEFVDSLEDGLGDRVKVRLGTAETVLGTAETVLGTATDGGEST